MGETNRIVAHYLDGKVLKGTTEDFFANRPGFHLSPVGGGPAVEVLCKTLKAVFFVKDFGGDPQRRDRIGFGASEPNQGKKVAALFTDGEVISGYTLTYTPEKSGFFITPVDSSSNNIRVYVLVRATREVGVGVQADALLSKYPPPRAA